MGSLFDARYAAGVFEAFAAVALGLQGLGVDLAPAPPRKSTPAKKRTGQQGSRQAERGQAEPERQLEDSISDFHGLIGVDGESLRSVIRMARGIFAPGLHMNLTPI